MTHEQSICPICNTVGNDLSALVAKLDAENQLLREKLELSEAAVVIVKERAENAEAECADLQDSHLSLYGDMKQWKSNCRDTLRERNTLRQKLESVQAVIEAAREYKTLCVAIECAPRHGGVEAMMAMCGRENCPGIKLEKALQANDEAVNR